jgi:hypothetical protein
MWDVGCEFWEQHVLGTYSCKDKYSYRPYGLNRSPGLDRGTCMACWLVGWLVAQGPVWLAGHSAGLWLIHFVRP